MILEKVQKHIKEQNMIEEGDHIIVGLSGGADSVCLLLMLHGLQKVFGFSLEAVHVEHGIRGEESKADAAFSKALCKEKQIVFQEFSVDVPAYAKSHGLGLEEAARILRYEVFEQLGKDKKAKVALAHHMEDNAETILFQLARGSMLSGLCGIRPVRKSECGLVYIRPLLCLHREEIEDFLKQESQNYCVDSTNQELEYSRNYLRHHVLPAFAQVNSQAIAHINETAGYLSDIRDFLEEQVDSFWQQIAIVEKDIVLDASKLKNFNKVLQREFIYKAIAILAGGKKDISSAHVQQVLRLFEHQSGREISLPNGVRVRKEYETFRFYSLQEESKDCLKEIFVSQELLEQMIKTGETMVFCFGNSGRQVQIAVCSHSDREEIPRKTYTKWLDYDRIKNGFCIRSRQSGDYLIYDALGHRKKLKQYFVDEKIPITKRDEMILLAQENQVLWVVGGRMSEHVKVTEKTHTRIEITYKEEASYE